MTRPVHGGTNIAELRSLGLRPEDVLDFSASINPLGAPHGVLQAMTNVDLTAYPDTECTDLRETLASRLGVSDSHILVGNGSTELIHLTARAYLDADDSAVIFAPTFGGVRSGVRHAERANGQHSCWRDELVHVGYRRRRKAYCEAIALGGLPLQPEQSDGALSEQRRCAADSMRPYPTTPLLLLDEAYLPFVDARWNSLPLLDLGNVALLRSMTKDYALTALRLGYMLAPPNVVERVRGQQHSWSVNALAQAAGIAALADEDHVNNGRKAVQVARRYING